MTTQYYYQNGSKFKETVILEESAAQNGGRLKTKKLLFDKSVTKMTESEIGAAYPYSHELVEHDVIEEAILSKKEDVLIVYFGSYSPFGGSGASTPTKIIYDPSDGAFVSSSRAKPLGQIDEKDLGQFLKNAGLGK